MPAAWDKKCIIEQRKSLGRSNYSSLTNSEVSSNKQDSTHLWHSVLPLLCCLKFPLFTLPYISDSIHFHGLYLFGRNLSSNLTVISLKEEPIPFLITSLESNSSHILALMVSPPLSLITFKNPSPPKQIWFNFIKQCLLHGHSKYWLLPLSNVQKLDIMFHEDIKNSYYSCLW